MTDTLKATVQGALAAKQSQWFTVTELLKHAGIKPNRYETAARALRQLRSEGHVQARWSKRYLRTREWASSNGQTTTSTTPGQATVPAAPRPVFPTYPATGFKGGPGRIAMCTPVNMPTFVDATKAIVTEFMKAEKTFSAYDVTQELRERANAGKATIDLAEVSTVHVGGKSCPKIEHETVKGIVHDLHRAGKMSGYDRVYSGSYWRYAPASDDSTDDDDDSSGVAVIAMGSSSPDSDDYDGSPTI